MSDILDLISRDGVFVVRLLVAMVLGGLVGMERQTRGRSAGLRTNILVCLGSAGIIIVFQKLSMEFDLGAESAIRMDPARAAAGVITGIGFLGAGTIIKSNNLVRGLTTAASIWVVSAIGVTVGLGEYVIAPALTFLVLFSLYVLHLIPIKGDHYFSLELKWHGDLNLLDEVVSQLGQEKVHIYSRSVSCQPNAEKCEVVLGLRTRNKENKPETIIQLQNDKRFDEVAWK